MTMSNRFKIPSRNDIKDQRAIFANRICQLMYRDCDGNIEKIQQQHSELVKDIKNGIRNIYELIVIYYSIPLLLLIEEISQDFENYKENFCDEFGRYPSDNEIRNYRNYLTKKCKEYYA
jgi:hypothetical protein